MFPQWLKNFYYETAGRLTILNYFWHRIFPGLPESGRRVLHLGCGENYISLPGFINIDGNLFCRKDFWLDLTLGLPFPSESIDVIFSSHVLEHFTEKEVRRVLAESYRVLKKGGGIRLITPHLHRAIQAYISGDSTFFSDWPDPRSSLGGKLNNYLLCRNQHRLMFDVSFLSELLQEAGFTNSIEMSPGKSYFFESGELEKMQWEKPEEHRSLFLESFKDRGPCFQRPMSQGHKPNP